MAANMIELHGLSDNSPISVNVNCITHFYENGRVPSLVYEDENGLSKSKNETEIYGTAVFMLGNYRINVMESYDVVKARINNIKNRIRIDNLHI